MIGSGWAGFIRVGALLAALLTAGCAESNRGLLVALDDPATAERTLTVLAVTTRSPAGDTQPGFLYSGERGTARYVSLTLSMPPDRASGAVPTSAERPDPTKNIVLVSSRELSQTEFDAIVAARPVATATATPAKPARGARPAPVPQREALVFIHGFNTRFDESVVRFAQIVDDTRFKGVPILFSWPSRGEVQDYGYDKDSANYSRDTLASLLMTLARERSISGIDVIGHSMGGWLTLETLRQIAIANDQTTLNHISEVVLAAPDVDMDVFRTQVARLGPLAGRVRVYSSNDDYALRMSRRLFGGKIRAGENTDIAQFEALGVSAEDISKVAGGVGKNHGKAFGDSATLAEIGQSLDHPAGERQSAHPITDGFQKLGDSLVDLTTLPKATAAPAQ